MNYSFILFWCIAPIFCIIACILFMCIIALLFLVIHRMSMPLISVQYGKDDVIYFTDNANQRERDGVNLLICYFCYLILYYITIIFILMNFPVSYYNYTFVWLALLCSYSFESDIGSESMVNIHCLLVYSLLLPVNNTSFQGTRHHQVIFWDVRIKALIIFIVQNYIKNK